jgi:two-component system chemotaxis response regulator CheY
MAEADVVFQETQFLVVDDHTFVRRVVTETLKGLGAVKILGAADGAEALMALKNLAGTGAGQSDRLCVLTDFEMPNLDGIDLLKAIRAGNAGVPPSTPVLMLTGSTNDEASLPARDIGVSGFVSKPVTREILKNAIIRALAHSPAVPAGAT